jgi:hypothetical protein
VDPTHTATSPHSATYSITAQFHEIPRMKITGVLIGLKQNVFHFGPPTGIDLMTSMARFLPMLPTPGYDYNACIVQDIEGSVGSKSGWNILLSIVNNLRSASTERAFYVGLISDVTGSIPLEVRGIGRFGSAVAAKDDTRALSHELGHAVGQDHVNVGGPAGPYDTGYSTFGTFPFGSVGEVGIDTERLTLYDPATSFDYMTYNENGPKVLFTTSTWVSPYNYTRMMRVIRSTAGTGDAILADGGIGDLLLLNFRVFRDGRVEVLPSYPVTGVPWTEDSRAQSDVVLDLYTRDGELIDSYRSRQHNPYQDPDGPYVDYHEVLPWHGDVGEIVFARHRIELDRVRVGGTRREVRLEPIIRAQPGRRGDLARIEWTVDGPNQREDSARQTAALIRYTNDGGRSWQAVAANVQEAGTVVNLDLLPGGEACHFEVIVASGLQAAVARSEAFQVRQRPRRAHIISPEDGQRFRAVVPMAFVGGSHSPDFGVPSDGDVVWTSNRECCVVGIGTTVVCDDLAVGTHRITLTTPDGEGGETSTSIRITVEPAPADDTLLSR